METLKPSEIVNYPVDLHRLIKSICLTFFPKDIERNSDIIVQRFGLNGQNEKTLDEIGKQYGLTRERIRQIESKLLYIFSCLIKYGEYTKNYKCKDKRYYLTSEDKNYFFSLIKCFQLDDFFVFYDNLEVASLSRVELNLILKSLSYEKSSHINSGSLLSFFDGWIHENEKKKVEHYCHIINFIFENSYELPLDDFYEQAKNKDKNFSAEYLDRILGVSKGVSIRLNKDSDKWIEVDMEKLPTLHKAYRILKNKDFASIDEILNEIKQQTSLEKEITHNNLRNQMVSDERFEPLGKSGLWKLKLNKNTKNITILQAIKDILYNNHGLTVNELYEEIIKLRDNSLKKRSIVTYLSTHKDDFVCLVGNKYILREMFTEEHVLKEVKEVANTDLFDIHLLSKIEKGKPFLLSNLVKELMEFGYKEQTIRTKLKKLFSLNIFADATQEGNRNKTYVLCDNYLEYTTKNKKTKREIAQQVILEFLQEHPNTLIKKGDLYLFISKDLPCGKQTFYRYLSEINDERFKTIQQDNHYYVLFEEK